MIGFDPDIILAHLEDCFVGDLKDKVFNDLLTRNPNEMRSMMSSLDNKRKDFAHLATRYVSIGVSESNVEKLLGIPSANRMKSKECSWIHDAEHWELGPRNSNNPTSNKLNSSEGKL